MTPDINIQLKDISDTKFKEMVVSNPDGSYTIFINSRLSYESQIEAREHALGHIYNRDFEKYDIQMIEYAAHGLRNDSAD